MKIQRKAETLKNVNKTKELIFKLQKHGVYQYLSLVGSL